jgi:uncharacterized protein (TIGR02145 family)
MRLFFSYLMNVVIILFIASCQTDNSIDQCSEEININEEVKIGYQVWKKKNLNTSMFRNGDSIPQAKSVNDWMAAGINKQPAWCYYENDPTNNESYGKLYNWYAINDPRGLVPEGWHIPTDLEWSLMTEYIGGDALAGKKLKSTKGCISPSNSTNETGFSSFPGGIRSLDGAFNGLGVLAYYWTKSEVGNSAFARQLVCAEDNIRREGPLDKGRGLSIRMVRD